MTSILDKGYPKRGNTHWNFVHQNL